MTFLFTDPRPAQPRTVHIEAPEINKSAIEAGMHFDNPASGSGVIWQATGFVLQSGPARFPFRLGTGAYSSLGTSHWYAADFGQYNECWRVCSLTMTMQRSGLYGELFGLPALAKALGGHLKEGRALLNWEGRKEYPGRFYFADGGFLAVNIIPSAEGQLLMLGGIPAGYLIWPNTELLAHQHLSDTELARCGIPRLSERERLPEIWSPSAETLLDIRRGLLNGQGIYDFDLNTWSVPLEMHQGNTDTTTIRTRLARLRT